MKSSIARLYFMSDSREIWLKICVQNLLSDVKCLEDRFIDSCSVLMGLNEIPSLLAALFH